MRLLGCLLAGGLALVGCASSEVDESTPAEPPSTVAPSPSEADALAATTLPASTSVAEAPVATTTPPTTSTVVAVEEFRAAIRTVGEDELGVSWRPGCPVAVGDLRALELTHWDDTGDVRAGVLVVHVDHADDLAGVFADLFEARFPIHSIRPITDFGADDDASMAANNSSGFNCRTVAGTSTWSEHAYGGAVDINPRLNPWVRGSAVAPPEGAAYLDRGADVPGLIRAGDVVTEAFAAIGWGWGGDWSRTRDYQHFSHNGR